MATHVGAFLIGVMCIFLGISNMLGLSFYAMTKYNNGYNVTNKMIENRKNLLQRVGKR